MKLYIWLYLLDLPNKGRQICVDSISPCMDLNKLLDNNSQNSLLPWMITAGFIQSKYDYFLFTCIQGSNYTFVLVYVNDILIKGNNSFHIQKLKHFLNKQLSWKTPLRYFLGIEVALSKDDLFLTQCKYTMDILSDSGITGGHICDISNFECIIIIMNYW